MSKRTQNNFYMALGACEELLDNLTTTQSALAENAMIELLEGYFKRNGEDKLELKERIPIPWQQHAHGPYSNKYAKYVRLIKRQGNEDFTAIEIITEDGTHKRLYTFGIYEQIQILKRINTSMIL